MWLLIYLLSIHAVQLIISSCFFSNIFFNSCNIETKVSCRSLFCESETKVLFFKNKSAQFTFRLLPFKILKSLRPCNWDVYLRCYLELSETHGTNISKQHAKQTRPFDRNTEDESGLPREGQRNPFVTLPSLSRGNMLLLLISAAVSKFFVPPLPDAYRVYPSCTNLKNDVLGIKTFFLGVTPSFFLTP